MKTYREMSQAIEVHAKKLRQGDSTIATRQAYEAAVIDRDIAYPRKTTVRKPGWWNSPLAAWAWNGDSRDMKA